MTDQMNIFVAVMILGVPMVLMAGGVILQMGLCLLWLALLGFHPIAGVFVGMIILLHKPLKLFFQGLFIGEGVRASGVVSRLSQRPRRSRRWTRGIPRGIGRRPRDYFPWNDDINHIGE